MHMNLLPLWICSSILFQEALGTPIAAGDPSALLGTASVASNQPAVSNLEKNIDWALSEFEKSLNKTQSNQLKASLHKIFQQYDLHIKGLERTLAEYKKTAQDAITAFDQIIAALSDCRAQKIPPQPYAKNGSAAPALGKRDDQLYLSYLTLKRQYKDAQRVLQTQFPGFKNNTKKIAGLAEQFEDWKKSTQNNTATPASSTPSKA
jgi:hypothetical protein